MKTGRKKKYTDVELMQKKIDEYFSDCDEKGKPYTMSGLAYAMGFKSRKALVYYDKDDEFSPTIKKAKQRCETWLEEQLYTGKSIAGVIFGLKNNYDWKDKTEQEITATGLSINVASDKDKKLLEDL